VSFYSRPTDLGYLLFKIANGIAINLYSSIKYQSTRKIPTQCW